MNSILLSPTEASMFINFVNLSSNTIKDSFSDIRGKIGELPNHRRETVAIDIIHFLLSRDE